MASASNPSPASLDIDRSSPWWSISLRGIAMGAADVVPGVSGGTMALVLGIYPRFIRALSRLDLGLLRRLLAGARRGLGGVVAVAREADLFFLVFLGVGIVSAVLTLAKIIPDLIATYPATMNGLFFGMIVASTVVPYRMLGRRGPVEGIAFLASVAFAYWVTGLGLLDVQEGWGFLFVSGAIAICAMLLPGISGSFLLLILGQYTRVLGAIHDRDLVVMGIFGLGCIAGLLSFSRVLEWLLTRHRTPTLAALCGLMVGSLRKIWPFDVALDTPIVIAGKTIQATRKVWPWDPTYDGPLVGPLVALVAGLVLVAALERVGRTKGRPPSETPQPDVG